MELTHSNAKDLEAMGGESLAIISEDHVGGGKRQSPSISLDGFKVGSGEVSLDGECTGLVLEFTGGRMFKSNETRGKDGKSPFTLLDDRVRVGKGLMSG